ncbi:tetratricopeptide repeat protein [Campylobacter aviculae]|uniref:ATP-dependent nuclease subunit B n=1 Tax=Campylobacter aviculae TaxID=2510190 RepID=A0A4U7BE74_9BACT|nr:ATP-dependent nuclease subunit B [Campylobacter aviculae]TKX29948.1 ATP-dependent nuclease subunit B [Campylobacter aviculae]
MYRNYLFILIATLLLSACTGSKTIVVYPDYKELKSNSFDLRVMKAYNYEYFNQYKEARDEFLKLFKDYNDTHFLENAFLITLVNDLDKKEEINNIVKFHLNENDNLKRLSALYELNSYSVKNAKKLAQELLKKENNDPRNLELYGDILMRQNDLKNATKYYRMAYSHSSNEETLLKLVSAYAILNDTTSIKNLLENSRKANGCTFKTCILLAKIYNDEKNFKALGEVYLQLYDITKNKDFVLSLVELLNSQNKTTQALQIALQYDLDDDVKLYLYQKLQYFDKAQELSMQIYKRTHNKEYLLRAAVFEFENASLKKKITLKIVQSVKEKFEKAIDENTNDLYLNYYGYLLIDYDLDVKKGIKFVELALKKDPQNLYYLDSLAWGYYKLGDCKKAWEVLQKTFQDKEFSNSNESKAHIKAIKACLKP